MAEINRTAPAVGDLDAIAECILMDNPDAAAAENCFRNGFFFDAKEDDHSLGPTTQIKDVMR